MIMPCINTILSTHSEGHDRTDLTLPGKQQDLLEAIRNATKNPMIVVVMSGGPVDVSWAKVSQYVQLQHSTQCTIQANADALLWCGYPGQSGGKAIAQVIYGEVNPSGRLPYTIVCMQAIQLECFMLCVLINSIQLIMSTRYHSLTWACAQSLVVPTNSTLVMPSTHLAMD